MDTQKKSRLFKLLSVQDTKGHTNTKSVINSLSALELPGPRLLPQHNVLSKLLIFLVLVIYFYILQPDDHPMTLLSNFLSLMPQIIDKKALIILS